MTTTALFKLAPALLKAQKAMGSAKKDGVNPFFHSNYATLGSVMEVCKDALNNAEITVLQPVVGDRVVTSLLHSCGEMLSDEGTPIVCSKPNDPQAQGSAITYARRYGLQSLLFIPTEDDDAERAMARPVKKGTPVHNEAPDELDTYTAGGVKVDKYEVDAKGEPLYCDYHKVAMRPNKNGNRYHIVNDDFCNGFGTNSEKAEGKE